jgi:predicted transcriptional regulator
VPEQDENGGDIGELSIANQFPCYVQKDADPKVLFQRLVESGKRGIVLVVERVENLPKQGDLSNPALRKPVGVVTWESYSRTIIDTPGNETKNQLVMPSPIEAMDRDIALAYGTDDLIHSLQRIERQGVLVVLNSNDTVAGIATKRDIHNELAEELIPYQLIGLIENLLRTKIEEADFTPEVFAKASGNPEINTIDKMEFSNYVGIFSNNDCFKKLKVHGAAREMGQLLEKVRILRNQLMHFNQQDEIDYASELKKHYEAIRTLLKDE